MKKFNKIGYMIIAAGALAVGISSFINKRIEIVDEDDVCEEKADDAEPVTD